MKINTTSDTNSNTIRYMYLRDPKNPKRVVTVARMVDREKSEVIYGLSVCCPGNRDEQGNLIDLGDQYNKRLGRDIATGRLLTTVKNGGTRMSWDTGIVRLESGAAPSRTVLEHIEEVEHRVVVRRTIRHALADG